MQRGLVRSDVIHALEDIDLACNGHERCQSRQLGSSSNQARNLPWLGQSAPTSHTAGHVLRGGSGDRQIELQIRHLTRETHAHPWGMWRMFHLQSPNACHERKAREERTCKNTYTETCVVYCLLLWSRTELRPGPLALSTVVSSARMTKVSLEAKVRLFATAVPWST